MAALSQKQALLFVTLSMVSIVGWTVAEAKPKEISRSQSKIDVRIQGLRNSDIRYLYLGWNDDYSIQRYAAIYFSRDKRQFLQAVVSIVATDEFYWTSAERVTLETIKRIEYFALKKIRITFQSPGINAQSDSSAGGPNYLGFSADGQNCVFVRRFSAFGEHGGTSVPYAINTFYCAPLSETLSEEQAAAIANSGMIFIRDPSGGDP